MCEIYTLRGDREGIASLLEHNGGFLVDSGTPVEVIASYPHGATVRIQESPERRRVGWVTNQCLR
jgi:hypothetical protein